jgi:hypothetical protein
VPLSARVSPREDADQRGLAGAVGAEEAEKLAFLDIKVDTGQRPHRAEGFRQFSIETATVMASKPRDQGGRTPSISAAIINSRINGA